MLEKRDVKTWAGVVTTLAIALGLSVATGCSKEKANGESTGSVEQSSSAEEGDENSEGAKAEEGSEGVQIDNGGITSVPNDPELAKTGKELFQAKGCQSCHKMEKKLVGPALGGVTDRRDAAWLARMILHPEKMLKHDETAKKLLAEHMTPMPNQGVTPEEARALIAFLGTTSK